MANKFARSNGNFDGPIWALTSGGVAGSTTTPTIGDNAIANTFTIQITGSVSCDNIHNGTTYGGSNLGSFILDGSAQPVTLTASVTAATISTNIIVTCLSGIGNFPISIRGDLRGGIRPDTGSLAQSRALTNSNTGTLSVTGNILNASFNSACGNAVLNLLSPDVIIYGDITGCNGTLTDVFINDKSNANITMYGNVASKINLSHGITLRVPTSLTVYGNIDSIDSTSFESNGINIQSNGCNVFVVGNVSSSGGNQSRGIQNNSNSSILVQGNVASQRGNVCINNPSTGSINVQGNVSGGVGTGIVNTSTGSVTVVGNVVSDSRGGAGIASSNANANVRISGNLIGAPNGIPAVYAAAYTINPVPSQAHIRHANNGTGVGSDAYLYYYTTDSLSAFSVPPVSAVRAGLQYANNTLTGTCQIPAASAVTFGALVDNTSGTAAITSNTLFDVSVTSLTASDSLGARLKNSATVESVGRIIASFSN